MALFERLPVEGTWGQLKEACFASVLSAVILSFNKEADMVDSERKRDAKIPLVQVSRDSDSKVVLEMLDTLGVPALHEVIQRAEELRTQKLEGAKQDFLARVKAEAEGLGLSLADLAPTTQSARRGRKPKEDTGTRASPPVKYRGPNGETWTGRGRQPNWLGAMEDQGRHRNEFLVDKGQQAEAV